MNTKNPFDGRFTLSLLTLFAFASAACGAAPGDSTGAEDPTLETAAPSTPGATDIPHDSGARDAGKASQQPGAGASGAAESSPVGIGVPGTHRPGGYLSDQAPHTR